MMAKNFPADEFDSVVSGGGRHRAKPTAGSRLLSLSRYAVVAAALSVTGIFALDAVSGTSVFTGVITGSTASGQSGFNANGLGVTVIDTTSRSGLASKVARNLLSAGWNVLTATNSVLLPKLSSKPAPSATPATQPPAAWGATPEASSGTPISQTTVYVTTDAAKSAASGILKLLGNFQVVQSNQYADPITVVLATDYK